MKVSIMLHTLIVITVVVFGAGFATGYIARGKPSPAPAVEAAAHRTAVAVAAAAKAETVYVHDVRTATRWQTVYDTARVHDTVSVDRIVYVARSVADSTVHACRGALSSCAIAIAAKDSALSAKDQVIAAQVAAQPSRLHRVLHDVGFIAIGFGLGRINARFSF